MIRDECLAGFRLRSGIVIAVNISVLSFTTCIASADKAKSNTVNAQTDYKQLWGERYIKGVHSLKWDQTKGWNGLVPGKSSIAQVIKKLGPPSATERDALNWDHYGFHSCITVWAHKTDPIASIELYPSKKYLADFPLTVHDAKIMYGPIKRRLKLEGDVTEAYLGRPGLTIVIASDKDDAQVNYIRFTAADDEIDKKSK